MWTWFGRVGVLFQVVAGLTLFVATPCYSQDGVAGRAAVDEAAEHSAESVLQSIQLADDDLQITLVASEPTVVDPVAGRFDERGRLWVVEMRDYPNGPAEGEDPNGRIVILEDKDHDGFFETSTTFADKLMFPTGLQPWKGGAFVTLAGEIAYFHDEDRDGVCERKETWFTGFAEDNEQLRANHPTLGPDGMIYVPCGLRGGEIRDARPGHENAIAVNTNGRDFRFDPNGDKFEAVAGRGQFGLTFDDYGRRFVCMNAAPLDHVVIEEATLGRNPNFADSTTIEHVIPGGQTEPVYPLVEQWTTSTFHKGSWTAACGVHIHRGDGLGEAFNGNAFTCEPTGALVHREILTDKGPTFEGRPAYDQKEFLASTDIWFRPVNLFDGPDGALYIVDMARKEIEHPQWLPPEARERYDFVTGNTLGRIYRVSRKGAKPGRFVEQQANLFGFRGNYPPDAPAWAAYDKDGYINDPGQLNDDQLLDALRSTRSNWLRETVFRLMTERRFVAATESQLHPSNLIPSGLRAVLNAKAATGRLTTTDVLEALVSDDMRQRELAVILARRHFPTDDNLEIPLTVAVTSPDAKVRFQAAISLGNYDGDSATSALVDLAARDADDPWMRRAILSSLSGRETKFASQILERSSNPDLIAAAFELAVRAELSPSIQAKARPNLAVAKPIAESVLNSSADDTLKRAALLGVARSYQNAQWRVVLNTATATLDELSAKALEEFRRGDASAAEFVGWFHPDSDAWGDVIREPISVDALGTFIGRLSRRSDFPTDTDFLASLGELRAPIRASVLNAMWSSTSRATALLKAVRDGHLAAPLIDNTVADRLRKHRDNGVAKLAAEVLPAQNANRVAVINDYKPCLELDCAASNGAAVFKKQCATCHRVGDAGGNVGPDLSDLRTKTPEQILQAILDPNAAIDANYINHTAITADGQVFSGLLVSQSDSAVTLRGTDAKDVTILRSDLETLTATGQSIMPEGLERQLDQQAMADVIYYLKNWRFESP